MGDATPETEGSLGTSIPNVPEAVLDRSSKIWLMPTGTGEQSPAHSGDLRVAASEK